MKKTFLLVLTGIVAFSCRPTTQKALDFNNKIASYSQELEKRGSVLGPALKKGIETKDFSGCGRMIGELENYIRSKTVELDGLENVNGSENLKSAMKDFMRYEKELADEAFVPFMKFDARTSNTEIQAAVSRLIAKSQMEANYLEKVRKEQQAYAAKNGFRIEDPK